MHGCTTLFTNTQLSHRGVFPALILSSQFTGTILQDPTMSFVWQEGSGAETWWAQSQAPQVCHSSTLSAHRSNASGGIASQPRLPCMGFLCPGWMHSEYTGGALGSPAGGFVGPVCKFSWHSTSVKSLGEKLQASVNS